MRLFPLISFALVVGCSNEANHLGNPLLLPFNGIATAIENVNYADRRGKVELLVKSDWPAMLTEIDAGGGALLSEAMDVARIRQEDRPARILQLQGDSALYAANPGALVSALMAYGS